MGEAIPTPATRILIDKTGPPRPQNIFWAAQYVTKDATKMPPYDSDSGDDEEEYTETNVLLGYATSEPTGDAVSHLGGVPVCSRERHA